MDGGDRALRGGCVVSTGALALLLGAAAVLAHRPDGRTTATATSAGPSVRRVAPSALARHAAAGVGGIAAAVVVGGPAGVLAALAAAVVLRGMLARLEPAAVRRRREDRAAVLPVTLDLLAVCLRAGAPLVQALELVAAALGGPLAHDLGSVAARQRLGAGPRGAWSGLDDDPVLAPVARVVRGSAESGARLAAAFDRLATEQRAAAVTTGEARARRAGVVAMAPLGLCFLPAFVCLGVVPVVLSIATTVLR